MQTTSLKGPLIHTERKQSTQVLTTIMQFAQVKTLYY